MLFTCGPSVRPTLLHSLIKFILPSRPRVAAPLMRRLPCISETRLYPPLLSLCLLGYRSLKWAVLTPIWVPVCVPRGTQGNRIHVPSIVLYDHVDKARWLYVHLKHFSSKLKQTWTQCEKNVKCVWVFKIKYGDFKDMFRLAAFSCAPRFPWGKQSLAFADRRLAGKVWEALAYRR